MPPDQPPPHTRRIPVPYCTSALLLYNAEVLNVEIACQKKMQEGTWKGSWSGEGACNPPAWSGATTSMSGTFETQAGKDDCLEDVKTQK